MDKEEARKKAVVQLAIGTLSYSELEAVEHIFNELEGNEGLLVSFNNDTHHFEWRIWKKGLVIRSESDIIVNLTLRLNSQTKGHIETEFGKIDLDCHTSHYDVDENCVEVKYSLIQGNEKQEFHFVLYINKEDTYAVN